MPEKAFVDGVELNLSEPVYFTQEWVGQEEVLQQILACWSVLDPSDIPLCPRIVGKPGVGKTTLAISAARKMKQDVYIFQCTMDTRPEDLLVTPVLRESGKIQYQASSVVTAMIRGGVCILDEANRMSEKSWASLAPLLDQRRYVDSIVAGVRIQASPQFRACVTMNEDASTYELPDYILSRLQPTVEILFPPKEEELIILRYNIPFAEEEILQMTVEFLQKAHQLDLKISTRDGIHMVRYYLKRKLQNPKRANLFEESILKIIGEEGLHLDSLSDNQSKRKRRDLYQHDLEEMFSNSLEQLLLNPFGNQDEQDEQDEPDEADEPPKKRKKTFASEDEDPSIDSELLDRNSEDENEDEDI
ncbi:MAG: MoxR family ATPase [Planctomycetota bacterium]